MNRNKIAKKPLKTQWMIKPNVSWSRPM